MAVGTEANDTSQRDKVRPPYVPFLTLKNFIGKLKADKVPHRIDKSVMGHLSGAAQSHLLLALKFLGLIDESGRPIELERLVDAYDTPGWGDELATVIKNAYHDVLVGVNLVSATPATLSEAFRREGTEGTVTDKAVRFLLKALDDANVAYSKHLNRTRGPRKGSRQRRQPADASTNGANSGDDNGDDEGATQPQGMISFPIHLPGKPTGKLTVPKDIDGDEVELVNAVLDYVRLYAQHNSADKPPTRKEKKGADKT